MNTKTIIGRTGDPEADLIQAERLLRNERYNHSRRLRKLLGAQEVIPRLAGENKYLRDRLDSFPRRESKEESRPMFLALCVAFGAGAVVGWLISG